MVLTNCCKFTTILHELAILVRHLRNLGKAVNEHHSYLHQMYVHIRIEGYEQERMDDFLALWFCELKF
jgi:hypothetical protein